MSEGCGKRVNSGKAVVAYDCGESGLLCGNCFAEEWEAEWVEGDVPVTGGDYVPFRVGVHHRPGYYGPRVHNPRISDDADVEDVVHAFDLDAQSAEALRHLIRAGRKPGESAAKDLTKVMEWTQRRISFLTMEAARNVT